MKNNLMLCVMIGLVAVLLMTTAVYAQPGKPTPSPCFNGVQDEGEGGIDCGGVCALTVGCVGNCTSAFVVDYCDGKDNDKDCVVDEDCKPSTTIRVPITEKDKAANPQAATPSCNDGFFNQDEVGADCGGICATNEPEVCDGKDNNNDCLIDRNPETRENVCSNGPGELQYGTVPGQLSEMIGLPEDQPGYPTEKRPDEEAPKPYQPDEEAPKPYQPESVPETPATEINETESIKLVRQFAKDNNIYIPDSEPDAELLKKYMAFAQKHEAEFAKKYGNDVSEKDAADVLRQFSEEAYPKPKPQSFVAKVAGFFKRLFS